MNVPPHARTALFLSSYLILVMYTPSHVTWKSTQICPTIIQFWKSPILNKAAASALDVWKSLTIPLFIFTFHKAVKMAFMAREMAEMDSLFFSLVKVMHIKSALRAPRSVGIRPAKTTS